MPGHRREYDGQFAVTSIGFTLTDPRLDGLKASAKWLNHVLWCLAVKERSEVLPAYYYPAIPTRSGSTSEAELSHNCSTLARFCREDPRTIAPAISQLQQKRLIDISSEGEITVFGVMAKHPNLKWKTGGLAGSNGPISVAQTETETEAEGINTLRCTKKSKSPQGPERKPDPIWEHFAKLYQTENGSPPTPQTRLFVGLARIRKIHKDPVILKRLDAYFAGSPEFVKPPHDFSGFLANFDRISGNGPSVAPPAWFCPKCGGGGFINGQHGRECLSCSSTLPT